ncbi:MAG: hypothetical protein IKT70_05690 [Clostridia bacterium]|nr:hypothetical protein [Clostridia bacterium]
MLYTHFTEDLLGECEIWITDSVTFCICNVFHNKYHFVLVFGITVTKGYSAVISHDATQRGASLQITKKQKKSETIADWQ